MLDVSIYLIASFFIYSFGYLVITFFNFEKKFIEQHLYLYPSIGLFFFGLLIVCLNFLFSIKGSFLFIIFLIIFTKVFFIKKANLHIKKNLFYFIIINFFLTPYLFTLQVGSDGGLYHLNIQNWIQQEKIVFGFSNIHSRYGFASLQEYLSAVFSMYNYYNGKLFSNLIFLSIFIYFIYECLMSKNLIYKNLSIFLTIYLILNFLGFKSFFILSPQKYSYVDTSTNIIYLIFLFLSINFIYKKIISREAFLTLSIFLCFAFFMKIYTLPIVVIYFYYLTLSLKNLEFNRNDILFVIFIFFVFFLKNIIHTGCLIYPIVNTCLDLISWTSLDGANSNSKWVAAWYRDKSLGLDSLNNNQWIISWLWKNSIIIFFYFLKFFICALIIKFLKIGKNRILFNKNNLFFVLTILLIFSIWFFKFPAIRFGNGYLMSFFVIIFFILYSDYNFNLNNKYHFIVILFILFFPFKDLISLKFNNRIIKYPEVNLEKRNSFGFKPQTGVYCWNNKDCYPYKDAIFIDKFSYKFFYKLNDKKLQKIIK